MRQLFILVMGILICMSFGCASYMSYQASENEEYTDRILASGDKDAIQMVNQGLPVKRAIRAIEDPGMFGIAIDLTAMDVITKHPWRQLGAAILDAVLAYCGYLVVDELGSSGDKSDTSSDSRDTNVTITNSEGVDININGDTSNTTTGDGNE
jgi:hypothetical protein